MPTWMLYVIASLVALGALHASLALCVRRLAPSLGAAYARRRWITLWGMALGVTAAGLATAAISGDSERLDHALMWLIRERIPDRLSGFFEAVTFLGSSKVLLPTAAIVALMWWRRRRRHEALLLSMSVAISALLGPLMKALVGRSRPELWDAAEYWGSSFPSGHTFVSTAFATALAMGAWRIRPSTYSIALLLATLFAVLVGLSRIVLGVHWPTDVAASWCLGSLVPMLVSANFHWRSEPSLFHRPSATEDSPSRQR